ncbi:MAG: hypothetical protein J2P31_21385 [Blastocatellia bacterium]|nr:hypothetical protein [Blastocatellia bacterium]
MGTRKILLHNHGTADDLALLTLVSCFSSFPNYLCVWVGALAGLDNVCATPRTVVATPEIVPKDDVPT